VTAPGGYSAGTIFLKVVPSFEGFQDEVSKQAKATQKRLNDEQGTEGTKQAGKRGEAEAKEYAGKYRATLAKALQQAERELTAITLRVEVDDQAAAAKIKALTARVGALKDAAIDLKADFDSGSALAELTAIKTAAESLRGTDISIGSKTDLGELIAQLAAVQEMVERLSKAKAEVEVKVDVEPRSLGAFATKLRSGLDKVQQALGNIEIDVDSTDAQAELYRLAQGAGQITPEVNVREALSDLRTLNVELDQLIAKTRGDDAEIEVFVNATKAKLELAQIIRQREALDGSTARVKVEAVGFDKLKDDLNNNGNAMRAFSGRFIAFALVVPLAIPAIVALSAALGGLGVALLGAGVGLAVLAFAFQGIMPAVKALGEAEAKAGQEAKDHAAAVRTAARSVRDAQQALAQARMMAARSAEDAARRIDDALRDQAEAERDLRNAQQDSAEAQRDLTRARKEAKEAQQASALDLRQNAVDERQAVVDLFEAEVNDINTRQDPGSTNLDKENASIGLEQRRIALERIRAEGKKMRDEAQAARKLDIDDTEKVRAAQDRIAAAKEREYQATLRVQDANRSVADAYQEQARGRVDSAAAIRNAEESLSDALARQREVLAQIGTSAKTAQREMEKLGPAGQAFATFLNGLRPQLKLLRDAVQEGMLPGVQSFLQTILGGANGAALLKFVTTMATLLGDLFKRAGEALKNPAWTQFFAMIAQYAPIFTELAAQIGGTLLTALANLAVAFAPFGVKLLTSLLQLVTAFERFTSTLSENPAFQTFLDMAAKLGPKVMEFFLALVDALLALGLALAPYAGLMLELFIGILKFIAGMDADTLGAITFAILALILGLQALFALASVVSAFAAAFAILSAVSATVGFLAYVFAVSAATIMGWILVGFAVIAFLVIMYVKFDWFRNAVNGIFSAIGKVIKWLWTDVVKPTFDFIIGWVMWAFQTWKSIFELIWAVLKWLGSKVAGWWNSTIAPHLQPLVDFWNSKVKPVWEGFKGWLSSFWGDIQDIFKGGVIFVVDTVINNGLIDNFNKLASSFGTTPISRIQLPASIYVTSEVSRDAAAGAMATGGKVRGWSPTDTADNIPAMLTAGEYVLPVGATRKLRAQYGDDFLEQLRRGALPGFAKGGLVDFGRLLQQEGFQVGEHPSFGTVHRVHATNSKHYVGQAIDVNYGPGGESDIEKAAIDRIVGLAKDYGLRTIWRSAGHFNHAHFETSQKADIVGESGGGLGGTVRGIAKWIIDKPLDYMLDAVTGLLGKVPGGPLLGGLLGGVVKNLAGAAADKLKGIFDEDAGDLSSPALDAPSDVTGVKAMVQNVAAGYGWGAGSEWNALHALIQKESSWNPSAQNPTSTAFGLFQFLNGTWGGTGVPKTGDAGLQAKAGLRYVADRYGSPSKAWAFHQKNNWYSEGGEVEAPQGYADGGPVLYDSGGWLPPGLTTVLNASGRPEPVLTAQQWDRMEAAPAGGGDTLQLTAISQANPEDIADAWMFAQRRLRRGGKHTGGS